MQRLTGPGLRLRVRADKVMMRALERCRGGVDLSVFLCVCPCTVLDADPGDDDLQVLVMYVYVCCLEERALLFLSWAFVFFILLHVTFLCRLSLRLNQLEDGHVSKFRNLATDPSRLGRYKVNASMVVRVG